MKLKLRSVQRKVFKYKNLRIFLIIFLVAFLCASTVVMAQNGWVRVSNGGDVPGTDLKESPNSAYLAGWYGCSNGGSVHINGATDWNSDMCDDSWEPTMQHLEYALGGNNHIEAWWHTYTKYGLKDYKKTIDPVRAWCAGYITPGEFIYDESACLPNGGGTGDPGTGDPGGEDDPGHCSYICTQTCVRDCDDGYPYECGPWDCGIGDCGTVCY
jgi:hypothetical protein